MSIQSLTDQELVEVYLNGNEKGLETLLTRHKSKLFSSILVIVRDRALAEDIFRDTFIKVIQILKKGQYKEDEEFLQWVYRISNNVITDHFRRIKKMTLA